MRPPNLWGIVLAAGAGRRLRELTTDRLGTVIPKQYCSLAGGPSLLRQAISRLRRVVEPQRILVVVAAAHRRWWLRELSDVPAENIVIQPCDRGTACGVLLPLTTIADRDPDARIVVSPADHHVEDEETLLWSMMEAVAHVDSRPRLLVLLGMEPDRPETEYGWITADPEVDDPVRPVLSFIEKPDTERARMLFENGALWSSFIFVTTAHALLEEFRRSYGWLVDRFGLAYAFSGGARTEVIGQLYSDLPSVDFSGEVLEHDLGRVHVLAVPPCGWTDIGNPERAIACIHDLARAGGHGTGAVGAPPESAAATASPVEAPLVLARALETSAPSRD